MSNSSDALVGAAGMKARKRGLSQEITAGASFSANSWSTPAGSWGSRSQQAGQRLVEDGLVAGEVQGYRIERQRARGSSRRSVTPAGRQERTSDFAPDQLAPPA